MKDSKPKKVTKKLQDFINQIAYIDKSDIPDDDGLIYYSKTDGSYLTRVGMEENLEFLLKRGITEQIQDYDNPRTASIGFNPKEQKWYGWSHRAIYGFTIGSQCKKGSCGFEPSNQEEFIENMVNLWKDEKYSSGDDTVEITTRKDYLSDEMVEGALFKYTYNDKIPNETLRGTIYQHFKPFPKKYGKGEWTATTLEEAKEMAINFAKSVS